MSTHPYIPLYVDDFEAATAHLTNEEDGVYNRLIRLAWRTPGCSLPTDPAWLARKIRTSVEDFERVARPILDEFFTVQRGRYVQRRLKREYDDITRKKTARKLAGKSGGEAKARKQKDKSSSNASVLLPDTRAFPYPEPEPEPKEDTEEDKSSSAVGGVLVDPDSLVWTMAVSVLTDRAGMSEKAARSFFGKLVSTNGLEARDMLPAVSAATVNGTQDPKSYLTKAAKQVGDRRHERLNHAGTGAGDQSSSDPRRANTESRRGAWADVIAERDGFAAGDRAAPGGAPADDRGEPGNLRLAYSGPA